MPFLSAIRPHLHDQSEIQLRIRKEKDHLSVTVIPRLSTIDADTTDETLAQFHAALSRPFFLTIPESEDPDAVLAGVLGTIGSTHEATLDGLARYQAEVAADAAKAREKAAEKQAAATAAQAKKTEAGKAGKTGKATATDTGKPAAAAKPPITKAAAAASPAPEPVRVQDLFGAPPQASVDAPADVEQAEPLAADAEDSGDSEDAQESGHE